MGGRPSLQKGDWSQPHPFRAALAPEDPGDPPDAPLFCSQDL